MLRSNENTFVQLGSLCAYAEKAMTHPNVSKAKARRKRWSDKRNPARILHSYLTDVIGLPADSVSALSWTGYCDELVPYDQKRASGMARQYQGTGEIVNCEAAHAISHAIYCDEPDQYDWEMATKIDTRFVSDGLVSRGAAAGVFDCAGTTAPDDVIHFCRHRAKHPT